MFIKKIKLWLNRFKKHERLPIDIEKLPYEIQALFYVDCKNLAENKTLGILLNNLIDEKIHYIARKASNRPFIVTEGELERYGIIILEELQDKINAYASRIQLPEKFDKHDPF